jgi:hypothetical protein
MAAIENLPIGGRTEAAWSVFVVFDDPPARNRATAVCEFITNKFWPSLEFDLHWCDVHRLESHECAQKAVECARTARIVIFATSARMEMAPGVVSWLENWSRMRRRREGILIALIEAAADGDLRERTDLLLRRTAHLAGLDYLTEVPEFGPALLTDEQEWIDVKAHEMGSVLGNILTTPIPPPQQP